MFSLLGIIIGARIGLKAVAVFWYGIGLMYVVIKFPLWFYERGAKGFIELGVNRTVAQGFTLIVLIVFLALVGIRFGAKFFQNFGFDRLSPGLDRALGGALAGGIGYVISQFVL